MKRANKRFLSIRIIQVYVRGAHLEIFTEELQ